MADGRRARSAQTEQALITAASELFVERGYAQTTLADVARRAGVSARTLYVRFANKAELLKRVVDVAVVGDLDDQPLRARDWIERAMSAPTLDERISAFSTGSATLQKRLAPVLAVAMEVETTEPIIAQSGKTGREGTRAMVQEFWTAAQRDDLLPVGVDLDWVIETAFLLTAADTAVLRLRTVGLDGHAGWLARAFHLLARPSP